MYLRRVANRRVIIIIVLALVVGMLVVVTMFVKRVTQRINFLMRDTPPIEDVIPWGVWERDDSLMWLYIKPEYRTPVISYFTYPVLYIESGIEKRIFIDFNTRNSMIGAYRPHLYRIFAGFSGQRSVVMYSGYMYDLTLKCDRLLISTLRGEWAFNLVAEYAPINLEYWR